MSSTKLLFLLCDGAIVLFWFLCIDLKKHPSTITTLFSNNSILSSLHPSVVLWFLISHLRRLVAYYFLSPFPFFLLFGTVTVLVSKGLPIRTTIRPVPSEPRNCGGQNKLMRGRRRRRMASCMCIKTPIKLNSNNLCLTVVDLLSVSTALRKKRN